MNELLRIEKCCLQIINSNDNVSVTRYKHRIPTLQNRLNYLFLIAFFKLLHSIVPIIDRDLIPAKPRYQGTRLASTGGFVLGAGLGPSLGRCISEYNALPWKIRSASFLKDFKKGLRNLLFADYIDDIVIDYLLNL